MTDAASQPSGPPLAPRGWYADPQKASGERWWTGTEWSSHSHRAPGPLALAPGYTRSYWIGPNRDAGKARAFTQIAGILLLAAVVVGCLLGARFVSGTVWYWGLLSALAVSGLLHIGGIIFGRLGLRRADELGARGASVSSLVVSSIELLVCLVGLLVLTISLALHVV